MRSVSAVTALPRLPPSAAGSSSPRPALLAAVDPQHLARHERAERAGEELDHARDLVEGFLRYWDSHRAVLRTRNLAAQEGDQRFRDVRNASLEPLTEGLSRKVAENDVAGLAPYAAAAALVAMMERMAAFHTDLEAYGASRADVVETTARIVFQTVTGRARP